jgi:hypothetical protein
MPRNRGQIPPYGKNFRRESLPYHPEHASRAYVLKQDSRWFIMSDKTSEVWTIYVGYNRAVPTAMGKPLPTLTAAMAKLLDGIAQGFYAIRPPAQTSEAARAALDEAREIAIATGRPLGGPY